MRWEEDLLYSSLGLVLPRMCYTMVHRRAHGTKVCSVHSHRGQIDHGAMHGHCAGCMSPARRVPYHAALYVAFGWSRSAAVAFPLPRAPSPALLLARSRHARSRAPPSPSPLRPSPHPANGTTASASPSSWCGTPQPSREPSVVSRPSCSRPPRPPRAKPGHR
jgi:hypothetical protein